MASRSLRRAVADHSIAAFLVVAFAASWAYARVFLLYVEPVVEYPLSQVASLPFAWGPLVAAAAVAYAVGDGAWRDRVLSLADSWAWLALAFAVPVVVQDLPELLLLARGEPVAVAGASPVQYVLVFGFTLVLGGALEEFGWRAFLQERLQARFGALAAAVAVGVAWTAWHYPLHAAGYTLADDSLGLFTVYIVGLAVVMAWVYNSTRGLLPVMVFHAAHNMPDFLAPGTGASTFAADHTVATTAAIWLVLGALVAAYAGPDDLATRSTSTPDAD